VKISLIETTFSVGIYPFTLCFVEEPEKVLSEAKRVLKKDGGLVIGIINREKHNGVSFYLGKRGENHHIYKHAEFYSTNEVVKIIGKVKMRIEGYSSTLCQPPSEKPHKEAVHNQLINDAGFICILARKNRIYQ